MPRDYANHENAALAQTRDGRAVVYMGDDERGEFIYKFLMPSSLVFSVVSACFIFRT